MGPESSQPPPLQPHRLALAAVLGVALIARLYLALVATPVDASDAFDYRRLGLSLAHGEGFRQVIRDPGSPVNGLEFLAYRPPGYPFFRALLFLVSEADRPTLVAQALLEVLALALAYALVAEHLGRLRALVGTALLATYVLWTASLTTESLSFVLAIAASYVALSPTLARRLRGGWRGALFGLVVGAAVLTRPTNLVLVLLLALVPRGDARAVRAASLSSLGSVVGGWVLRNALVLGAPVLSTNAGMHAATSYDVGSLSTWASLHRRGLGEAAISRELGELVWRAARRDPEWLATTLLERLRSFYDPLREDCYELGTLRSIALRAAPAGLALIQASSALLPLLYTGGWIALVLQLRRRETLPRVWLAMSAAFAVLHVLVSRVDARLVAPAAPWLVLGLGAGLGLALGKAHDAWRVWRARASTTP